MASRIFILFLTITCFIRTQAQDEPKRYAGDRVHFSGDVSYDHDLVFSIGFNTDFPNGEWKKYSHLGIGPEAGLWYHFNDNWAVTGRFSYLSWPGQQYIVPGNPQARYKNQQQWYFNPGVRYNFNQNFWINPELGYSQVKFDTEKGGSVMYGLNIGADVYGPGSVVGLGLGYQSMTFKGDSRGQFGLRVRIYIGVKRDKVDDSE